MSEVYYSEICRSENHTVIKKKQQNKAGHLVCVCCYLFSRQHLMPHICVRRSSTDVRQDKSLVH